SSCQSTHLLFLSRPLLSSSLLFMLPPPPRSTLFPYTTLFRSAVPHEHHRPEAAAFADLLDEVARIVAVEPEMQLRAHADLKQQRSEEHTSELQSHLNLVCRLLLEKKKKNSRRINHSNMKNKEQ